MCLSSDYNKKLFNLPSSLKHLSLGLKYNEILCDLPIGLEYLSVSHYYNKELNILGINLIELHLGMFYLMELKELPSSLKHVIGYKNLSKKNRELIKSLNISLRIIN